MKQKLFLIVAFISIASGILKAKDKDSFIVSVKDHLHANHELSVDFKNFTKKFGSPIWAHSIETEFEQSRIGLAPVIDHEHDYTNGVLLFMSDENNGIRHTFISRDELMKKYVNKKKSQRMVHRKDLVAAFLKFDLKLFNSIDHQLTQAIGMVKGREEEEIKNIRIEPNLMGSFE